MVVRVLDHVETASTYDDGEKIFALIRPAIERNEVVTVSFEGLLAVPSAFINSAFVRLLETIAPEQVRSHLRIVNSTRQINDLLRSRIAFVTDRS